MFLFKNLPLGVSNHGPSWQVPMYVGEVRWRALSSAELFSVLVGEVGAMLDQHAAAKA